VVALIGVELRRTAARASGPSDAERHHSVEQRLQHAAVVHVCRDDRYGEQDAHSVEEEAARRPRLALVGRVRACDVSSFFAARRRLSRLARVEPI